MSKYRDTRMQQRVTVFLGIFLAVAMGASLIVPALQTAVTQDPNITQPTVQPSPTVPAPPAIEGITFDERYLHGSGIFSAPVPSGWQPDDEFSTIREVQGTMRNADALSVIEMRVIQPGESVDITSMDDLDAYFDPSWLGASWREYTRWDESTRRVDGDRLIIDFTLERQRQQFIARHVAYADDDWIYVVRVVMPSNAPQVLTHILNNMIDDLQPNKEFVATPFEWPAYFDTDDLHLLRHPSDWQVVDAAPGLPASLSSANVDVRIEAIDEVIDSEDAARQWVENTRSRTEVLSVGAFNDSGYRVSYRRPTIEGTVDSGLVVLLNDGNQTHIVNATIAAADVDLNSDDYPGIYDNVVESLNTFTLFPSYDDVVLVQ